MARRIEIGTAMRLLGLVALLLPWPALAQELDINGYTTILVLPPSGAVYGNPATIVANIREAASAAGFKVIKRPEEGDVARTVVLVTGMDIRGGGTVGVAVLDLRTRTRVAFDARAHAGLFGLGSGSSGRRTLQRASKAVIDSLGYTGYDPAAHQRNLLVLERAQSDGNAPSPPEPAPEIR